jgi:hypothetical protein
VRKTLFATIFIAILSFAATAQDAPIASASREQTSAVYAPAWGLPQTTGKILFYGGDANPTDPNTFVFDNENTVSFADTSTYAAVKVPGNVTVSAMFINGIAYPSPAVYDPATATYDIRTGVSSGNGGTEVASGSGALTVVPTGRTILGFYPEYTLTVRFQKPVSLKAGTTYWANLTPQCTNVNDANCAGAGGIRSKGPITELGSPQTYYIDNTTQETNGVNAKDQVAGQVYFNSAYYGVNWQNWCTNGIEGTLNSKQCARLSFGFTN